MKELSQTTDLTLGTINSSSRDSSFSSVDCPTMGWQSKVSISSTHKVGKRIDEK